MSKAVESQTNSSTAYKDRFVGYLETYVETLPEPPDPMAGGTEAGVQKGALRRQARYNDPKQRQSVTKGTQNA